MNNIIYSFLIRNGLIDCSDFDSIGNKIVKTPMDIYTTNEGLFVEVALVGNINKEDVVINVDSEKLILRYDKDNDSNSTDKEYLINKINKCKFNYEIKLDSRCNHSETSAELKNGLLRVHVPFLVSVSPKQVEIK